MLTATQVQKIQADIGQICLNLLEIEKKANPEQDVYNLPQIKCCLCGGELTTDELWQDELTVDVAKYYVAHKNCEFHQGEDHITN